jgi:hypothetical protein
MTVTGITPDQPLSGYEFPEPAVVMAEAYWWHLAALREAPNRDRAAHHVQALATAAGHIAVILAGPRMLHRTRTMTRWPGPISPPTSPACPWRCAAGR